MKHYNNSYDKKHGEYVYTPGIGIGPKSEQKDDTKSVELARKVNKRQRIDSSKLERWE